MKTKTLLIVGLVILILGIGTGIGIGYKIWHVSKKGITLPVYFPVIVKVKEYITKPIPYEVLIPPHITYKYMSYKDSMALVYVRDSLICLVSTGIIHDTIKVKTKFLTAFPTQPKLINLDLQMDSINVTLLNIQAELYTLRYPLNLFGFKYRYDGFNMSVKPLQNPYGRPTVSKWDMGLYGYLGTNIINYPTINPILLAELRISYSRINLSVEPNMTINKHPELGINLKAGYKLWSWPKR